MLKRYGENAHRESAAKIHLLHGAQTRLVQNAAIAGDAPGTLSRLGTEPIQGQCASARSRNTPLTSLNPV